MSSSEVAVRQGGTSITQRAREDYDPGQLALIRASVAKECNDAELGMFLEICARYQLDPFSKQVWAIKIRGAVQTIVSRDGLLALANRHTPAQGFTGPGEFLGCESDVVRKGDTFRKARGAEGTQVEHSYDVTGDRGPIVGAWAIVHRREHSATYFYAEWSTYNTGQNVWKSHPETMIVKSAEAMALRKAFSITGMIGEAEVDSRQSLTATEGGEGSAETRWPEDAERKQTLETLFGVLGYRRAKIRALVNACASDEQFDALIATLNAEVDSMPEPEPEVVDAEPVA